MSRFKKSTRLKRQLEGAKEWARKSREVNEPYFVSNMGLLYMQVAIEQIINYLDMEANIKEENGKTKT